MSNSSNNNNAGRGNNVDRRGRSQRGGSGSSSVVTVKHKRPLQLRKEPDRVILDERGSDQGSMSSTLDSFSSTPSMSLADEVEVKRTSEQKAASSSPQQQRNETRGETHSIRNNSSSVVGATRQLPLSEVVSRRAFECVVGTNGELSKLIDVTENDTTTADDVKSHGDDRCTNPTSLREAPKKETDRNLRRASSCERSPTSACRLEPIPYGAGVSIGNQVGTGEETRP